MQYVKLIYDNNYYNDKKASNLEMFILGCFFSNVWNRLTLYREWALMDKSDPQCKFGGGVGTNLTFLEEMDNYIFISDRYSDEKIPTELKISRQEFVQLLDDWQEKVCDKRPKHVIIKHENNEFIIETSDQEFLV